MYFCDGLLVGIHPLTRYGLNVSCGGRGGGAPDCMHYVKLRIKEHAKATTTTDTTLFLCPKSHASRTWDRCRRVWNYWLVCKMETKALSWGVGILCEKWTSLMNHIFSYNIQKPRRFNTCYAAILALDQTLERSLSSFFVFVLFI